MKKTFTLILALLMLASMIIPAAAVVVTYPYPYLYPYYHQHTLANYTKVNDTYHSATCSYCNQVITEAHKWNTGVVTTAATATTAGVKTYTCVYCGATKTAPYSLTTLQAVTFFSVSMNGNLTWQAVQHAGSYRVAYTYNDSNNNSVTRTVDTTATYIDLSPYLPMGTPVTVTVTALAIPGTDYVDAPASQAVSTSVKPINWSAVAALLSMRTFNVTATAGEGGTISPSGTVAVRTGAPATFEITPSKGYEIENVIVDGKSVGAVEKIGFEHVREDHTIEVSFVKVQQGTSSKEVDSSYPYAAAVAFAEKYELFTGAKKDKFGEDEKVTRSEFVTALGKLVGLKTADYKNKASAKDVKSSDAAAPYVAWALENDLVTAENELFRPDDSITREEAVMILARYAVRLGKSTASKISLSTYKDVKDVSAAALPAMKWAVEKGYLPVSGKNLEPQKDATRGELAQLLYAFCLSFK